MMRHIATMALGANTKGYAARMNYSRMGGSRWCTGFADHDGGLTAWGEGWHWSIWR